MHCAAPRGTDYTAVQIVGLYRTRQTVGSPKPPRVPSKRAQPLRPGRPRGVKPVTYGFFGHQPRPCTMCVKGCVTACTRFTSVHPQYYPTALVATTERPRTE
eukprot:3129340-Prymnesium_polylepis.1